MQPLEIQIQKKTKKGANVSLIVDPDESTVTFITANSKETRPIGTNERSDYFMNIWMAFWYELSLLPHETEKVLMEKLNDWIENGSDKQ